MKDFAIASCREIRLQSQRCRHYAARILGGERPDLLAAEAATDKLHDDNTGAFLLIAAVAQFAFDRCADFKIIIPMIQANKAGIGYDPDRDGVALPRPQLWYRL